MMPGTFTIRDQSYDVAPWLLRIAAKSIDAGLCYGVLIFIGPILSLMLPEIAVFAVMVLLLGVSLWWWFTSDAILQGASVGKRLIGLRLVHQRHGSAPSSLQAALRQLKYSTFLSLWGLMAHSYDERHGRSQDDGFVTVQVKKPGLPAAPPPLPPSRRPMNLEALGAFLSDRYADKKEQKTPREKP
jgi:hypothetical protein